MLSFDRPRIAPPDQGAPCDRCDGSGNTYDAETRTLRECLCSYARQKRAFLGAELFDAEKVKETPLIELSEDRRRIVRDLTARDVWVTAKWSELLPHLRLAFGIRWHYSDRRFGFRIVTDEKLRAAYFGEKDCGTLATLIDGPDLLIVRLGFTPTKYDPMPAIILKALMHRRERHAPVWIVDTPSMPLKAGHFAWSAQLGEHVGSFIRGGDK